MAGRLLVIGCGALAAELAVLRRLSGWDHVDFEFLAPELHNRPERIAAEVETRLQQVPAGTRAFVAYADCGTGGALDAVLARHGAERLPGAHCYELFAGGADFAAMQEREPGTFYLTDFLARQFDRLVIRGLGLDRHPELRDAYFGNYRRLVYLAQTDDEALDVAASAAAGRLGLEYERVHTGLHGLAAALATPARTAPQWLS